MLRRWWRNRKKNQRAKTDRDYTLEQLVQLRATFQVAYYMLDPVDDLDLVKRLARRLAELEAELDRRNAR